MSAPVPYFDVVRQMSNAFNYRLRLVTHAGQHGIKAAARAFRTTVATVRKWLRRYAGEGLKGLQELSRAPRSCPHKIVGELAQRVVELRRQLPTFGARRLKREWELPLGHGAISRILREHGLTRRRRRKYQKKQDLAALKETWALFQQISADTKDLDDIPHYWAQMKAHGLPAVQYTAREVRSGLQFLAFASRRSAQASTLFAQRIQAHLQRCGVHLRDVTWQTDNGGEFVGEQQPNGSRSGFPRAVTFFGSQHVRIPPAAHTYQSDVETVHRLIEDEFFDLETFRSRAEFLAKVSLYQLYFNLARPNSHKRGLTPWQIIQQLAPRLPLHLCLLPPVFLDYRLDALRRDDRTSPQRGYHLPRLPYALYWSSRLVTLLELGWGGPMGEELLRSSVAEGLMGADGVVGPLPVLEFLVERGDLERAGGDLIKLLRMGALGALDRAVEFGRAGRQDKEPQPALLAGVFEGGGELTAAVDLHRADREGHALLQGLEKAGGRRGPRVRLQDVPAREHIAGGELLEHHAG
jgi:transposase